MGNRREESVRLEVEGDRWVPLSSAPRSTEGSSVQRRQVSRCTPRGASAPDPGAPPGSRYTTPRHAAQPTRLLWRPASRCRAAADRSASGAAPTKTATSSSGVPTPSVATAASVAEWRRSRSGGRRRRGARMSDHGAACTTRRRRPRHTSPRAPRGLQGGRAQRRACRLACTVVHCTNRPRSVRRTTQRRRQKGQQS